MNIEQFVLNDDWSLTFEEQELCCYSQEKGAIIVDNALIVDPRVESVECSFLGKIEEYFTKNGEKVHKITTYDTVIFSSPVSLDLTSVFGLKTVIFLKGANSISCSKPIDKEKMPRLLVGHQNETKLVRFCNENGIKVYYAFGTSTYLPIKL